jgi:hypothetical protein
MTVSTTANKVVYNGNGATTAWPFSFPLAEADHLSVILTDWAGTETVLAPSVYSVTGIGSPSGGTVTYPLAGLGIATGNTLTLLRTVPFTQGTVLSNQGGYFPEVIEDALDLIYMALQQLKERLDSSLRAPVSDDDPDMELPAAAARAGGVLGFDDDGNPEIVLAVPDATVSSFMATVLDEENARDARIALGAADIVEPALLTAGGLHSGRGGISRAVQLTDNLHYHHFDRGLPLILPGGRIFWTSALLDNHGSANDDALMILKQVEAGGDLALDGQLGGGGTSTALDPPNYLYVRWYADESARVFTVTGTTIVSGVETPTVLTFNGTAGISGGVYRSTRRWKAITTFHCDGPTLGEMEIGVKLAPGSGIAQTSDDGGVTIGNIFALVDGLQNGIDQFYQSQCALTADNEILVWYFTQKIDQDGTVKTVRRINTKLGDADGWGPEIEVKFSLDGSPLAVTVPVAGRPIFYSQPRVRADGSLFCVFQGGPYTMWGTSTDKGLNWYLTKAIVMARTDCSILNVVARNVAGKWFEVEGDHTAKFTDDRKVLIWNSKVGDNGIYTVAAAGSSVVGGNTRIVVDEALKANGTITAATQAALCQLTIASHGYSVGGCIEISGVVGMTQLNGLTVAVVSVIDANTITITADSTAFTPYVSGGVTTGIANPAGGTSIGQISVSGIVSVNTGTSQVTMGGDHTDLVVGDMFPWCNSSNNNKLYTITARALDSTGKNTVITFAETIRSGTANGRMQNAVLGEFGVVWGDEFTCLLIGRTVSAGQMMGVQFKSTDAGGSRATYIGNPRNPDSGVAYSSHLAMVRVGGQKIVQWTYRWGSPSGNPYSICYRLARFEDLLDNANAWLPEVCIVSTTQAMEVFGVGPVTQDPDFRRSGYPFVIHNPAGDAALIFFTLETSNVTSIRYAIAVHPDYRPFLGGWYKFPSIALSAAANYTLLNRLDWAKEVIVEFRGEFSALALALLRISEDGGINFKSTGEYINHGNTGTATSAFLGANVSLSAAVPIAATWELSDFNDPLRVTRCVGYGGFGGTSTSGGTVTSRRLVAATGTNIFIVPASGTMTGTLEVRARA